MHHKRLKWPTSMLNGVLCEHTDDRHAGRGVMQAEIRVSGSRIEGKGVTIGVAGLGCKCR